MFAPSQPSPAVSSLVLSRPLARPAAIAGSRRFRLSLLGALVLGCLVSAPSVARADALDLVRSLASAPRSVGPSKVRGKARPRRALRAAHKRSHRRLFGRVRLTAAQRGSGRVQIIDASSDTPSSGLPQIESKGALARF